MKTKWIFQNLIGFLLLLGFTMLFFWFFGIEYSDWYSTFGITVFRIFMIIVFSVVIIWAALNMRILKFDKNGFTFYGLLGKIGFCSWESIEKAEYFYPIQDVQKNDLGERLRSGQFILVYNDEHYISPNVKENGKVYNRSRNGNHLYLNGKNHLAWAMTEVASFITFKAFFEYYRPDLTIETHESCIYK